MTSAPSKSEIEPYLIQLGNICLQYSALEYLISQSIWQMLKIEKETGIIITGQRDIISQCEMALEIAKSLNKEEKIINSFKKLRTALKDGGLSNKRNKAIHGFYFSSLEHSFLFIETHRGKDRGKRELMTIEWLILLGKDIKQHRDDLKTSLTDVGFVLD